MIAHPSQLTNSIRYSQIAPAKILLVDDNPADVQLIEEALRETGWACELTVAHDGDEALMILRRDAIAAQGKWPHMVLLDLNLPRRNGREVLAEIRGDQGLHNLPVVILTTSTAEEDILQAFQLKANHFFTKPIDFDDFVHVVAKIADFWFEIVSP